MGILRSLLDVYRQTTYVPEGDKFFTGRFVSKNCVKPSMEQLQGMFRQQGDLLYSNPFWSDPRILSDDKTAITTWQYGHAVTSPSWASNTFYFLFIVSLHTAACIYLWLQISSVIASIATATFLAYDALWAYVIRIRRRFNKYLVRMFTRGLNFLRQRSRTDYQTWLEELKESNFSQFVQIQNWHQQEELLAEARKQTAALYSTAASAAITAFNTSVVRQN
jgi:hypothetical protein